MTERDQTDLPTLLASAIGAEDGERITQAVAQIKREEGFLYSAIRDLLAALPLYADRTTPAPAPHRRIEQARRRMTPALAAEKLAVRMTAFGHWRRDGNQTIAAITSGELNPARIRPHVRFADEEYAKFYAGQDAALEKQLARAKRAGDTPERPFAPLPLAPNFNHAFRMPQAVSLIELLFGFLEALDAPGKLAWLDIACGRGEMANAVDPTRFCARDWEIAGADLQNAKIEIARRQNTHGRTFHAEDALEMMRCKLAAQERYHIVTMFEFLEHIDDPLGLLRQISAMEPTFVMAGSPLEQKLDAPMDDTPDRAHLWSYSREGWEEMFRLAGFEPVFSSEARVGAYVGGLDWLTIICGPLDVLKARRTGLSSARPGGG